MRRVSFALILVLLSFGLSFGQAGTLDIRVAPGSGFYGGDSINTNSAFDIDLYVTHQTAGADRLAWSMPYHFYGTGGVTTITGGAGTFTGNPAFEGIWNYGWFTYEESWDGDLTTGNTVLGAGDHHNTTGISGGYVADDVEYLVGTYSFGGFAYGADDLLGTFCMAQGDMDNNTYDWLLDPPSPSFATLCWPVIKQQDPCPVFTLEQTTDQGGPWHTQLSAQVTAEDGPPSATTVEYCLNSGPGAVDANGLWTWNPGCGDVGSYTVVIGAGDANNACGCATTSFSVSVTNQGPTISDGPCGETITIGTNSVTTYDFAATDPNTGDVLVWTATDGAFVGGTLTFTAPAATGPVTVTVTVTDCDGLTASCDVIFDVISELPFEIVIEKIHDQLQGHHAYVNITKEQGTELMHGFEFLIAYDQSVLVTLGAMQGAGIADWEYFTYRFVGNCGSGCPSGLLRIVAIADENNGQQLPPGSNEIADGAILATLDFMVSGNYTVNGQFAPVNFYWMDCGDNTLAMQYRVDAAAGGHDIKTAVAAEVWHYGGYDPLNPWYEVTDFYWGMPSLYGPDMVCFDCADPQNPDKCPVPFVYFFGGGVDIISVEDIDDRGDVNLNGISNEIADAVVFTNYFIYGGAAFVINFEGQKAATEVNGDGIALTVADLVYLIRVIVGDALPIPKVAPNIQLNVASGDIVSVDAEIGAAQFVFAGNVDVTPLTDMDMISNYRDGNTYVLVYSLDGAAAEGEILRANGQLISVEAADYNGNAYKTTVMPTEFSVNSYPNPFNPVATISMELPSVSDWSITIYNVVGQRVAQFSGTDQVVDVKWDASGEATGVYFYKAEAGQNSVTKKMVLLK